MKSFIQFIGEKNQQITPDLPFDEVEKTKKARDKWNSAYDAHADRGGMSHEQIIAKIGPEPK